MTVTVVGIGLIGGSFGLGLRDKGIVKRVIGVEANEEHRRKALSLQLVDEVKDLHEAVKESDLLVRRQSPRSTDQSVGRDFLVHPWYTSPAPERL